MQIYANVQVCKYALCSMGVGALQPKKPNATANFKFGTVFLVFSFFFSVFPFWPILTGSTGKCKWSSLVSYKSFFKTFAGLYRH